MIIKLDLSIADPTLIQENLEKPCCSGKLIYECTNHFLTPSLKTQLRDSVESDTTSTTSKIIAEVAKFDTCREFLLDDTIIQCLIRNLKGKGAEFLTQGCRALANLCYDYAAAQNIIFNKEGIEAVTSILLRCADGSEQDKQLLAAAIGLLLNIITDYPDSHQKVISSGVTTYLINFIRRELDERDVTRLSQHIILILVTLAESIPMEEVFTLPVCKISVELLAVCRGPAFYIPALQFLDETSVPDVVKYRLVQEGLCKLLIEQLEEHPNNPTEEETAKFELIGRVIANILTGDEAMEHAYQTEDPPLLERLTDWLHSEQYNLVYSSALCVGNVARTDAHSREIVSRGIHRLILSALQQDMCDVKMQHALLSSLRNLAIPKENKNQLISDGALEVLNPLVTLDIRVAAPVIFKLIGVWRQLADGDSSVALHLGANTTLIQQLVTWSDAAACPWVSSEALRLLCSLVTRSRDRTVVDNLLRAKALAEITKLLTSQHDVMQLEAINALAVGSALCVGVANQWEDDLVDAAVGEKLKLLFQSIEVSVQLIENVLTMLDTMLKHEKIRHHLMEVQLLQELTALLRSQSELSHLLPRLGNFKNLL